MVAYFYNFTTIPKVTWKIHEPQVVNNGRRDVCVSARNMVLRVTGEPGDCPILFL